MSAASRVLVFDSGVGALSIISHVRHRFPFLHIDFLSDDAFFPYGEKSDGELIERVRSVISHQKQKEKFNLLVVACNTASTVCLPMLREILKVPVVGVVPAIKPAAKDSLNRNIGILATPATIGRKYTHDLIRNFASDCTVNMHGSSALVYEAEKKARGEEPNPKIIYDELHALLAKPGANGMDRLVLGCTHFPLLEEELRAAAGEREIIFYDSGPAIAQRVGTLLNVLTEKTGRVGEFREFRTSEWQRKSSSN